MKNQSTQSSPLWLLYGGRYLLEKNAIGLLRHIDKCGSITQAAKTTGISYKTAWDLIDRLNNLSSKPLVVTRTGGRHGGGCGLSAYGRNILDAYDLHQKQFELIAKNTSSKKADYDLFTDFARSLILKTSARNQFSGVIEKIVHGPVSAEVVLRISDQDTITSVITNESAKELGLKKGGSITALIKASAVILMTNDKETKTSAMNRLCGTVAGIVTGAVNDEVKIKLSGGKTVVATITKQSAEDMKLALGAEVCALFNASQVILAITQ
jgi:molybdate transport system regulatory protein